MGQSESGFTICGQIVDLRSDRIFPGELEVSGGRVSAIRPVKKAESQIILPGLVDAHLHIESSMLVPSQFARAAVVHGTTGVFCDPHEIANVLGVPGIEFMLRNAATVPLHFYFGAPSCVPATAFETAGAKLGIREIEGLFESGRVHYLSEMMNFPGVIQHDAEVMAELELARKYGKPIDGHAPGLRGESLQRYIAAGISTDHETSCLEEALEKIERGMKVLIREGSAARNFSALAPLLESHPEAVMFCSDDLHPDDLLRGHINLLVKRALAAGFPLMNVLKAACLNPLAHYLRASVFPLLGMNDPADFIVIDSFENFNVLAAYIDGVKVAECGRACFAAPSPESLNVFNCVQPAAAQLVIKAKGPAVRVIEVFDGEIFTKKAELSPKIKDGNAVSDIERDIIKLAVVNRYEPSAPALGFVKNFGLKKGAIASSVAHDSHNIIAAGVDDDDLAAVINAVAESRGGIAAVCGAEKVVLPLPVAGLMALNTADEVGRLYQQLNQMAASLGSPLRAPFMTLSFLALLVIPQLKLGDRGLFDSESFRFVELFT